MKDVKSLTDPISKETEKTRLWADTLYLFHAYKKEQGPFYKAGYTKYKIQKNIKRNKNDYVSFDIIAWDEKRQIGCGIELTTNGHAKKDEQLDKYETITSNEFSTQIGIDITQPVGAILSTNHDNKSRHCHIILNDTASVLNQNEISDKILVDELVAFNGKHIRSPQPKFTMDPEPNKFELRNGLVSLVMEMIHKGISKTPRQLTEDALDFLYDDIDFDHRKMLEDRVKNSMDVLIKNYLFDIIEYKDGQYNPITGKSVNKKRKNVANKILEWVRNANITQKRIEDFKEK